MKINFRMPVMSAQDMINEAYTVPTLQRWLEESIYYIMSNMDYKIHKPSCDEDARICYMPTKSAEYSDTYWAFYGKHATTHAHILDHLRLAVFTTCREDGQLMYRVYAIEGAKLVYLSLFVCGDGSTYNDSYPVMDDWYMSDDGLMDSMQHIIAYASSRFILDDKHISSRLMCTELAPIVAKPMFEDIDLELPF